MQKQIAPLIIISFIIFLSSSFAQSVYEPVSNRGIYNFLDRMAQKGLITFNDIIRPVTRKYIAEKLLELKRNIKADSNSLKNITKIEEEEINFYFKDYGLERLFLIDEGKESSSQGATKFETLNNDNEYDSSASNYTILSVDRFNRWRLFSYSDNLFKLNISPILGISFTKNGSNSIKHIWNGVSAYGYLQNNVGFSFYFKDNYEDGEGVDIYRLFTPKTGIVVSKGSDNSIQYSDVHTNLTVDWSWGEFNIGKDFLNWGYGKSGLLVLSSKAPSFPFIRLDIHPTNWLSFNYIHGWLNSYIIDSSRSYSTYIASLTRNNYREKFYASHTLSILPIKGLNISIGESIIYSDKLEIAYLMPLMFFHFADHYLSKANNDIGQNSQLFLGISSRNHIKNTHLYGTLFIDEITISGLFDSQKRKNQLGFTLGASVTDLPIENLTVTAEYTRINPYVYTHFIPTLTYTSSDYNLGHWIGNNGDILYGSVNYFFTRGLQTKIWGQYIRKGESGDISGQYQVPQPPFLFGHRNNYTDYGLEIQYEIINEFFIKACFLSTNNSYEDQDGSYLESKQNNFSFSIYYGL